MKKILLLLFLFCSVLASSQVAVMGGGVPVSGGGHTYPTTEYQALLDEWTTDPTGDTLTWQNDMIYSLDSAGFWDRLDALFVFANTSNANGEALVDWINPDSTAIEVNNPTFTRWQGYTGDADEDYINTDRNLSTETDNYVLNSGTLGIYTRIAPTGIQTYGGASDGTNETYIHNSTTNKFTRINAITSTSGNITTSGFIVTTRRGASETELYHNGSSISQETDASSGIVDKDLWLLARNSNGTAEYFSSNQISIVILMDGVTDADVSAINTIFEKYMDHIGTGVQ